MASSSSRRHFLRQSGLAAAGISLGPLLNGCATGGAPKTTASGINGGSVMITIDAGATTIVAVDLDAQKLAWARDFGATHTVDASQEDPVEAVRRATGGFGADVCVEAVGHPKVLEQAFYARDLAGTVVQVGVPTPDMRFPDIPMIEFFGRGGALKPSWYGDCLPSRDFPLLVDLHLQGRLPLDRFVSETLGLDDVEAAFAKMARGEVLRSVVVLGAPYPLAR